MRYLVMNRLHGLCGNGVPETAFQIFFWNLDWLLHKVSLYRTIRMGKVSHLFYSGDPVWTEVRWILVYPAKIPGYEWWTTLFLVKTGAEFLNRDPALWLPVCIQVVVEQVEDLRITCHGPKKVQQLFLRTMPVFRLLAPWSVTAAAPCTIRGLAGSAAAGITEFPRGRAFLPVAGCSSPVLFATCTGMDYVVITFRYVVGWLQCVFGHLFTISYGCCTIITHMRINHLKDRIMHTNRITEGTSDFKAVHFSCSCFLFRHKGWMVMMPDPEICWRLTIETCSMVPRFWIPDRMCPFSTWTAMRRPAGSIRFPIMRHLSGQVNGSVRRSHCRISDDGINRVLHPAWSRVHMEQDISTLQKIPRVIANLSGDYCFNPVHFQ